VIIDSDYDEEGSLTTITTTHIRKRNHEGWAVGWPLRHPIPISPSGLPLLHLFGISFLTGQSETACFLGDENDGIPSKQITNGFCDMMQPSNNRNFTDGLAFCMAKKCLL
jgi:hypothetical protein